MPPVTNNPNVRIDAPIIHGNESQNIDQSSAPRELQGARSSGWAVAGRVALGILTGGLSELGRLAWQGIKWLCNKLTAAPAPEPRVQAEVVPGPVGDRVDGPGAAGAQFNRNLVKELGKVKPELTPEYQQAVDDAVSELRNAYGPDLVKDGTSPRKLLAQAGIDSRVFSSIGTLDEQITPERLKEKLLTILTPVMNKTVFLTEIKNMTEASGAFSKGMHSVIAEGLLKDQGTADALDGQNSVNGVKDLMQSKGVAQTVAKYEQGIKSAIDVMRNIFGPKLPDSIPEVISKAPLLLQKLSEMFSSGVPTADAIQDVMIERLKQPLLTDALAGALVERASEKGIPFQPHAANLMAKELMKSDSEVFASLGHVDSADGLQKALNGLDMDAMLANHVQQVNMLYAQHSGTVPAEARPMLKDFISGMSFLPQHAQGSIQQVSDFVNSMSNWKNYTGLEPGREAFNAAFNKVIAQDATELADFKGEADKYDENGIYKQIFLDAHRSQYTFNKVPANVGSAAETDKRTKDLLIEQFPNEKDRQFVSKIMNQRFGAYFGELTMVGFLVGAPEIANDPSLQPYAKHQGSKGDIMGQSNYKMTYSIDTSPDGKTATIKIVCPFAATYPDGMAVNGFTANFGQVVHTGTITVNLSASGDGPRVVSTTMSQQLFSVNEAAEQLA